jgi:hypothetical protein
MRAMHVLHPWKVETVSLGEGSLYEVVAREDDLDVNRADLSWAERLLDFSSSWVRSGNPKSLPSAPGVSISPTDFKGSGSHTGVRIPLVEADARAIKARDDADWKAKAAMKGSQTAPPPSKS